MLALESLLILKQAHTSRRLFIIIGLARRPGIYPSDTPSVANSSPPSASCAVGLAGSTTGLFGAEELSAKSWSEPCPCGGGGFLFFFSSCI